MPNNADQIYTVHKKYIIFLRFLTSNDNVVNRNVVQH